MPFPTVQVLVKYVMYVSQGKIPMSGGYVAYQWSCACHLRLPRGLTNQYKHQLNRKEASLQSY